MGSGSALVAAAGLDRRDVGYDLDDEYVGIARRRVHEACAAKQMATARISPLVKRAIADGESAPKLAARVVEDAGFEIRARQRRIPATGVTVDLVAGDAHGDVWYFAVAGAFTTFREGLRTDDVWRALGRAHAIRRARGDVPLVLLTPRRPKQASEGDDALRAAGPDAFFDVIELLHDDDVAHLAAYAAGGKSGPRRHFWSATELTR
jgi:hypothetical protein